MNCSSMVLLSIDDVEVILWCRRSRKTGDQARVNESSSIHCLLWREFELDAHTFMKAK